MIKSSIKILSFLVIFFSSIQVFANDTIRVNVKTNEQKAAALGFAVDGKKYGTRGKSYSGKGPANKEYVFGYRKNFSISPDISCGSKTLTKDSTITLVITGEHCSIVVD